MEGSAVTLIRGKATERTRWEEEPLRLAERWQMEGADGLHIIDLDAAFGSGTNRETILKITERAKVPVQVGGGIRSEKTARAWLDGGVPRIVIGTMAYASPSTLARLLEEYGSERVVVAADYKDSEVVTNGWKEGRRISVEEAVRRFERAGVASLLTTSVERDGTGFGPDVKMVKALAKGTSMGIMASGGIRDVRDLASLEAAGAEGAVIGRALYDGSLKLSEARRRVV